MAQQKVQNVMQAIEMARELGEVFLVSLSKEEIPDFQRIYDKLYAPERDDQEGE